MLLTILVSGSIRPASTRNHGLLLQVFHEARNWIVKIREIAGHWLQAKDPYKEVFGCHTSQRLIREGRAAASLEAEGDVVKAIPPIS